MSAQQCQVCGWLFTSNGECRCVRVRNLGIAHDALIIEVVNLKQENERFKKTLEACREFVLFCADTVPEKNTEHWAIQEKACDLYATLKKENKE